MQRNCHLEQGWRFRCLRSVAVCYGSPARGSMGSEIGRLPSAWVRYDDVAESYQRFEASNGYATLAGELVTALNLSSPASLLDVGCGSGAAILAAQQAVGVQGLVVGLDISLAMLRRAAA